MWGRLLRLAVLLLFLNLTKAVTRSLREFSVKINDDTFSWDPLLDPNLQLFSSEHNLNLDAAQQIWRGYESWIENGLKTLYSYYKQEVYQFDSFKWLRYTDASNQQLFQDILTEVNHLKKGYPNPRSQCNLITRVNDSSECLFFQILEKYSVTYTPIPPNRLTTQPAENLFALYKIAEELFNYQWYYHSEAVSFYLLFEVIPYFRSALPPSEELLLNLSDINRRILLLLCEVQRIRNNINASLILSLSLIQSTFQYSESAGNEPYSFLGKRMSTDQHLQFISAKLAIIQLRVLLTIPVLPPTTDVSTVHRSEMIKDLRKFQKYISENHITIPLAVVTEEVSATPFHMAHQGLNDLEFQLIYAEVLKTLCPELHYTNPSLSSPLTLGQSPSPHRTIRIGFISNHFFDHSIGRILLELMVVLKEQVALKLDTESDLIQPEIFVYFIDSLDIEGKGKDDFVVTVLRNRIGSNFRHLHMNTTNVRSVISSDNLDILLFADLGMDFSTYALAFARLATYQIAWWGHPITSGLPTIDFFFSLEDELLSADEHYSEQLVRMKTINSIPLPPKPAEWEQRMNYFNELDFPHNAKFAVILGRVFKYHPEFEEIIVNLLIKLEDDYWRSFCYLKNACIPYFIVIYAERVFDLNQQFLNRLSDHLRKHSWNFTEREIDKILSRIRLLQYNRYYFQLSQFAEVALDSYPYGGCITTHDALHLGLPIVSLPSTYIRGRFTLGMFRQMEILDLIAKDRDDYVEKVFHLLTDSDHRNQIRSKIVSGFETKLKQNVQVAMEWLGFFERLFQAIRAK